MVATASLRDELAARGFANLMHWPRGVDPELFKPTDKKACRFERPIFLNVGRVAVEKTSKPSLRWRSPAPKSSSVTVRRLMNSDAPFRTCSFSARSAVVI